MFEPSNQPPESTAGGVHLVFQRGELVSDLRVREPLLPQEQLQADNWLVVRQQFLGFWRGEPVWAVEIDEQIELDPMRYQRGNLYTLLGRVDEPLFALAGRAAQLLAWERDHQFCGCCGNPMEVDVGERAMRCEPCRSVIYPRIAPCIIVLVTRGEELLLARGVNFPRPMYSTLAGFIDDNPINTLAINAAGAQGIDPDIVGPQFHGPGFGQTDHGPLGRRIGRPQGAAEQCGIRGNIDDGTTPRFFQQWHCQARDIELPVEINTHRVVPILYRNCFHRCGGPGDTGVVHQDIQLIIVHSKVVKQTIYLLRITDIGHAAGSRRMRRQEQINGAAIDVANMHPAIMGKVGLGDTLPDPGGTRGHQDHLS